MDWNKLVINVGLAMLDAAGWQPGVAAKTATPIGAAKADNGHTLRNGATLPGRTTAGAPANVRPGVVYKMRPGYDKAAYKHIAASGKIGVVLQAVKDAGAKGIRAGDVATARNLNGKTVQSAMYHLRKSAMIDSHVIE
jgi:hypothetical protein